MYHDLVSILNHRSWSRSSRRKFRKRFKILFICQLVAYGRLKTKENFKLLAIKVVAVAYERWLLTRGYKYCDLTCKLLVFWKTGRWGEVIAYEKWSQAEVRLYSNSVKEKSLLQFVILLAVPFLVSFLHSMISLLNTFNDSSTKIK